MNNQENNKKQQNLLITLAIIGAGLIIGAAIVYTQKNKLALLNNRQSSLSANLARINVKESDHIRGNPDAPITIVEFSDFQCSFCRIFHSIMKQILSEYEEKIRWVYKHFPLTMIHSEAQPAAEASECAWEQKGNDGFWQYADLIFENQERLGKELYLELAEKIGLDKTKFEECLNSQRYREKVLADYQEGLRLRVEGTPGNFINGYYVPGVLPYQNLKEIIDNLSK